VFVDHCQKARSCYVHRVTQTRGVSVFIRSKWSFSYLLKS